MLRYLPHSEIDFSKWDACVAAAEERIVYGFSWYLNAVCDVWDAVVEEQQGTYVSAFPVPVKQRLGQKLGFQPFFTQQLGLFSTAASRHTRVADFLELLPPRLPKLYLQLNTFNTGKLGEISPETIVKERVTYHLQLSQPYEQLRKNYSTNHKRNIKKAAAQQFEIVSAEKSDALIQIFRQTKGQEVRELKQQHYERLKQLWQALVQHKAGQVLELRKAGQVVAGGLFLLQPEKIIYLFGAVTEEARKTGAMALLLDHLIQQHAGTGKVLDFEGSNIESIAKFYAGFGAQPVSYVSLSYNFLPWYLKWISR